LCLTNPLIPPGWRSNNPYQQCWCNGWKVDPGFARTRYIKVSLLPIFSALQANFDPEDLLSTTRTFGVNTISHFWILQAFLPGLIAAGKGHVVSVASLLGITGTAQLSKWISGSAASPVPTFLLLVISRLLRLKGCSNSTA
jgi:hypothetical protein